MISTCLSTRHTWIGNCHLSDGLRMNLNLYTSLVCHSTWLTSLGKYSLPFSRSIVGSVNMYVCLLEFRILVCTYYKCTRSSSNEEWTRWLSRFVEPLSIVPERSSWARHKFFQLYEDDMMSIWIFKRWCQFRLLSFSAPLPAQCPF